MFQLIWKPSAQLRTVKLQRPSILFAITGKLKVYQISSERCVQVKTKYKLNSSICEHNITLRGGGGGCLFFLKSRLVQIGKN